MRRRRLKAPEYFEFATYHCVSRIVDKQFVLQNVEREQFVRLMRTYEKLYALEVITFCVMSDHFHILVRVPARPAGLPDDESLVALVRDAHGSGTAERLSGWLARWREMGNDAAAETERERWFRQMWDVSQFMKVLKQRFTQWFNRRQPVRRRGTLWEERFHSVLVEDGGALHAMAAYIDLNPVRAGMVDDPKDYRWCGYGEACATDGRARQGLLRAAQASDPTRDSAFDTLAWYREQLFGRGFERHNELGQVVRRGFTEEEIERVRSEQGRLPRHEYLRLRIRYFTDGLILGSAAFVEKVFQARRDWFGQSRKTAARRLVGLDRGDPLRSARALKLRPLG
jgi:REP element-mobilizing transposase RayT